MAVNGQYEAGFALLVSTDFRVLLIDKKPKYLTLKDIRFDMITELDFAARMVNSTVRIYTPNKELRFTSTSARRLRKLFTYTQHKVMEIRHRFMMQQFATQHEMQNTPPGVAMAYMMPQPLPSGPAVPYELSEADHLHLPPIPVEPMQIPPMRQQNLPPAGPPPMLEMPSTAQPPGSAESLTGQAEPAPLYNPTVDDTNDKRGRLAAAMGAAGLQSLAAVSARIVNEYVSVPFTQRWHKRPYGFSRDSLPLMPWPSQQ